MALFCALSPVAGHSSVVAQFTGGEGNSLADQFVGKAGDGWVDAWNSRSGSGGTTTFSVLNANPLNSGGNYLQVGYKRTASAGTNRAGVARTFATTGANGIDLSQKYTISFDFRPDLLTGWGASGDQFAFSSESTTTVGGFGADAPWSLLIRGDNGWVVTNGNGTGGVTNVSLTSLGLTGISAGTAYKIVVEVDPTISKYDLTITTGAVTYRASAANGGNLFGFRTNTTAINADVLQFRMTNDAINDEFKFSIDNIAVIPEPGSMALVISGVIGFGLAAQKLRIPAQK